MPLYSLFVPQKFALALFYFLLGLVHNGPKRNWKQWLCKILEGQQKSIMVFSILANKPLKFGSLHLSLFNNFNKKLFIGIEKQQEPIHVRHWSIGD